MEKGITQEVVFLVTSGFLKQRLFLGGDSLIPDLVVLLMAMLSQQYVYSRSMSFEMHTLAIKTLMSGT